MPTSIQKFARPIAVCSLLFILTSDLFGVYLISQTWSVPRGYVLNSPVPSINFIVANLSFGITGAVLVWNRPSNLVGWFCLGCSLLSQDITFGRYLAYTLLIEPDSSLPSLVILASFQENWWITGASSFALLVAFFPTGRINGQLMALVALALPLTAASVVILSAVQPGRLPRPFDEFQNRLGIASLPVAHDLAFAMTFVFALLFAVAAADMLRRFLRSTGDERQQIKWLAYVSALVVAEVFCGLTLFVGERDMTYLEDQVVAILLTAVPIVIALAVLKYRLYDIDVLINRTLVYALLTSILAAAYFVLVVSTQALLRPLSGGSDLAIALTTLVIAASILPLRRRIQLLVDRHFNRRHYDATRTLDRFSSRLREQIDLDTLEAELIETIGETMEPARAFVWLRGTSR